MLSAICPYRHIPLSLRWWFPDAVLRIYIQLEHCSACSGPIAVGYMMQRALLLYFTHPCLQVWLGGEEDQNMWLNLNFCFVCVCHSICDLQIFNLVELLMLIFASFSPNYLINFGIVSWGISFLSGAIIFRGDIFSGGSIDLNKFVTISRLFLLKTYSS